MTTISYVKSPEVWLNEASGRAAIGATTATPYSLTLINNSTAPYTFYVYQQLPNQQSSNVYSLVWFCSPFKIVPTGQITFQWTTDYTFIWGATWLLQPGIIFSAAQSTPADPASLNTTSFSMSPGPNLARPWAGPTIGSLAIYDASNVPSDTFSVGIGMGSAGAFVTAARANLSHAFPPTPTYWIAAATNVVQGEVLDITRIVRNLQVVFPANVYAVSYTLNSNNEWVSN